MRAPAAILMLLGAAGTLAPPGWVCRAHATPVLASPAAPDDPAEGARRQKLAVLELHDSAGLGETAARFLSERLRGTALRLPPTEWLVITRENLLALLPPGTDLADCLAECEVETGRNIGADVIVTGEFTRLNDRLWVTLNAHRVDTGQLVGQEVVAADDLAGLEEAVAPAGIRLFATLGGRGDPGAPAAPATLTVEGADGMKILIDGLEMGTLPLHHRRIPSGRHTLVVDDPCHDRIEQTVTLAPDGYERIYLEPSPTRAEVTLWVEDADGEPTPAIVKADGIVAGQAPGPVWVPVCLKTLTVEGAGGHTRYAQTLDATDFDLRSDSVYEMRVQLQRPPRPPEPAPLRESRPPEPRARVVNVEHYPFAQSVMIVGGMSLVLGLLSFLFAADEDEAGKRRNSIALGGVFTAIGVLAVGGPILYLRSERYGIGEHGPEGPALPAWTPGLSLSLTW